MPATVVSRKRFRTKSVAAVQTYDETILVVVIRDHADDDFSALLLAKDLKERYRVVRMTAFYETPEEALLGVPALANEVMNELDTEGARRQKGMAVDFSPQ